jgi:valyl-tRNA synthetase
MLVTASWPRFDAVLEDGDARDEMGWVVRLIEALRGVRVEMNVPPAAKIALAYRGARDLTEERVRRHRELIERLGRIASIEAVNEVPKGAIQIVVDEATFILPLAGVIDVGAEKARLNRELDKAGKEIAATDKKLDNPSFVAKAPAEVVEELRERRADYAATQAKLAEALERLASLQLSSRARRAAPQTRDQWAFPLDPGSRCARPG